MQPSSNVSRFKAPQKKKNLKKKPTQLFVAAFTGAGIHSATVPAISGALSTRSQRSIESKSMESFFSARYQSQSSQPLVKKKLLVYLLKE